MKLLIGVKKIRSGDNIRKLATSLLVVCLVLTIFLVLPVSGENNEEIEYSNETRRRSGNALYVGPGLNYTKIQDAIDDAAPGDIISVQAGTYKENVVVNKTLTLIGNGASNTIIDGSEDGDVVYVSADWVNITGFNITNSGNQYNDAGIELNKVQNCKIENNFLTLNGKYGLLVNSSSNNIIVNNNASSNKNDGIHLRSSSDNTIINNRAFSNRAGISVKDLVGNTISNNIVTSNRWSGIFVHTPLSNTITNNICNTNYNGRGIYLYRSNNTIITSNTLINDGILIEGTFTAQWNSHTIDTTNTVNGNPVYYWKNRNGGTVPQGAGQIILANCDGVTVKNQILSGGVINILLGESSNNMITNNNATFSHQGGITLRNSDYNYIRNNNISSSLIGIDIVGSDRNDIQGNIISDTTDGVFFCCQSNSNTIRNNAITSSINGMRITSSLSTTITSNTCTGNTNGISIEISSRGTTINNNNASYNENYGIYISKSEDSTIVNNTVSSNNVYGIYIDSATNTKIYHNNFIDNNKQAYDNNVSQWNSPTSGGGNFWSDWTSPDNDKNGFVDEPYLIYGSGKANDPLPLTYPSGTLLEIETKNILIAYVEQPYYVYYTAFDPFTPSEELIWTIKTDAPWLTFSPEHELYGTPYIDHFGAYWVYIEVSDGSNNVFTNFTLSVKVRTEEPSINFTPPEIEETSILKNSDDISIHTSELEIEFSKPMNTSSIEGALNIIPATPYSLQWENNNTILKMVFNRTLFYDTTYTTTISTMGTDHDGNQLASAFVLNFNTELQEKGGPDKPGEIDLITILSVIGVFVIIMIIITILFITQGRRKIRERATETVRQAQDQREVKGLDIIEIDPAKDELDIRNSEEYIQKLMDEALEFEKPSEFKNPEVTLLTNAEEKYRKGEISKTTYESIIETLNGERP